jgi:hypothetical protein
MSCGAQPISSRDPSAAVIQFPIHVLFWGCRTAPRRCNNIPLMKCKYTGRYCVLSYLLRLCVNTVALYTSLPRWTLEQTKWWPVENAEYLRTYFFEESYGNLNIKHKFLFI